MPLAATGAKKKKQLDGCIVWNAHNTVLGEEALLSLTLTQEYDTYIILYSK